MNYKAVFLSIPIKLSESEKRQETFFISLRKGGQIIVVDAIPPNSSEVLFVISDKMQDLRYRVNDYRVYLRREGQKIDSVFSEINKLGFTFQLDTTPLMKKAEKGDTIIFRILNVQRINYENEIEDIPSNVELEYPVLE